MSVQSEFFSLDQSGVGVETNTTKTTLRDMCGWVKTAHLNRYTKFRVELSGEKVLRKERDLQGRRGPHVGTVFESQVPLDLRVEGVVEQNPSFIRSFPNIVFSISSVKICSYVPLTYLMVPSLQVGLRTHNSFGSPRISLRPLPPDH